jgi:hypothetical protein
MFKRRNTDRTEPRFDKEEMRHAASLQVPKRPTSPAFKLKGPPFSIRMLGLFGGLCGALGMIAVLLGFSAGSQGVGYAWILMIGGIVSVVTGVFYAAAYRVAIAILDIRDMMKFRLDHDQ